MSGQWEVVGKSKKEKNVIKSKKLNKSDMHQKFVDNAPKVEDLLPLAQVKTLYSALDTNKDPVKPVEKAAKNKENEGKKAQKKPKSNKKEAPNQIKPPKTVEAAVALISVSDLRNVLDVGQLRFPEAPLVWLKGLASWLNTKLPVDNSDNLFTAKSWEYPMCLLSVEIRSVLKTALKEVSPLVIQMFFDFCMTSMANDMIKGNTVTGYKMLLQLMASQLPQTAVADLAKTAGLLRSYQNRPAIGCAILWAVGQAGSKDVSLGLQVWQTVMFPVLELRHYSQFVGDYLRLLVARHSSNKSLSVSRFLSAVETIASCNQTQIIGQLGSLHNILCHSLTNDRLHSLLKPLLSYLTASSSPALKIEVLRMVTQCLAADCRSFAEWRQHYTEMLPQSALLLGHINATGRSVELPTKPLKDTLEAFKVTNDKLNQQHIHYPGLQDCTKFSETILSKMAGSKKSFPWRMLSFLVVLLLGSGLALDINLHGSFQASKTGSLLKATGTMRHFEHVWVLLQEYGHTAFRWSEANVPVYWAQTKQLLGPYFSTGMDTALSLALQAVASLKLVYLYCLERIPILEQWVYKYTPGLREAVREAALFAWQFGLRAGTLALKYLHVAFEWLQNKVFTDNLSPENLQRVTMEALNTTQTLVAQTLSWITHSISSH